MQLCSDLSWIGRDGAAQKRSDIKVRPELQEQIWESFESLCEHEKGIVRQNAISKISEMIRIFPEKSGVACDFFLKLCEDPDPKVREHATGYISSLGELLFEDQKQAFDLFTSFCDNRYPGVRNKVATVIVEMLTLARKNPKEVWNLIRKLCSDRCWFVRNNVANQISKMAEWSLYKNEAWNCLLKLYDDDDECVRKSAASQIPIMIELFPLDSENARCAFLKLFRFQGTTTVYNLDQISDLAKTFAVNPKEAWSLLSKLSGTEDINMEFSIRSISNSFSSWNHGRQGSQMDVTRKTEATKRVPAKSASVWDFFTKNCSDQGMRLRSRSNDAREITEMKKKFSGRLSQVFDLISKSCYDIDENTRRQAVSKISDLAKLVPQKLKKAWSLYLSLIKDEDPNIRDIVSTQMARLLTGNSKEEAWDLFTKLCSSEDVSIRSNAADQLWEMTALFPGKTRDALDLFMRLRFDDIRNVRAIACSGLTTLVKLSPVDTMNVLRMYQKDVQERNNVGKIAAITLALDFVTHFPEMKMDIWEILSKGCYNVHNDHIRNTAILQVADFVDKVPSTKKDALEILSNLLLDTNSEIRQTARYQLIEHAKRCQKRGTGVPNPTTLCNEDNFSTSKAISETIMELLEAVREPNPKSWEILSYIYNNADSSFCCSATKCITRLARNIWTAKTKGGLC